MKGASPLGDALHAERQRCASRIAPRSARALALLAPAHGAAHRFRRLRQAIFEIAHVDADIPPLMEDALAQIEQALPLGHVGPFLRALVTRQRPLPAVPTGLPEELAQLLGALREELSTNAPAARNE